MRRKAMWFLSVALGVVTAGGALTTLWGQEKKQEGAEVLPPCVVRTVPDSRSTEVDPELEEIRVTYDRPMMDQSWSWIIHRNLGQYPGSKTLGPPRWEDEGKTCVLPVALRPNTVYAIGCNSFRHAGFRDRAGRIAVPYILVFKTKAAAEENRKGPA